MLSSEEIQKYNEEGFLIPNFIMPEKDLIEIEELHKSLIEQHPKFRNYCPAVLLHVDRFLKYCNNKFLGLKLNTNATLLNEEKIHIILFRKL